MPLASRGGRTRLLALLTVLLALPLLTAEAQRPDRQQARPQMQQRLVGQIQGAVVEADTEAPVETATVAVWRAADSSLVTGTVTDAKGRFRVEQLRPGRYYVEVSFVGYLPERVTGIALSRDAPRADLGAIALLADAQQLDEIEVATERADVQFAIDRTVYNTKDQPATSGGSAIDVLQNVPSVEVDIDGNVSLRGNQNVAVLINGKPSPVRGEFLATFLQQLPANTIERVEVIPNPSAKYDPEGMAGILNIVLKEDTDLGTGGGLTLGVGTGDKYNASGNVSHQQGRWSLYANYGFRYNDRESTGDNLREYLLADRPSALPAFLEQDNAGLRTSVSHLVNANVDYKLSAKNSLSASALLSTRGGDNRSTNAYFRLDEARALTGRYERISESEGSGLNMDYSLAFKRVHEPSRHELSVEARFNRSDRDDLDRFTQRDLALDGTADDLTPLRETNDLDAVDTDWALQADYTRPLGERGKLEAGFKSTLRGLDNTFYAEAFDHEADAWLPETQLNNTFRYDEQVHAAYGIVGSGVGKWDAQLGLRVEQALTDFDLLTTDRTFENDYRSFFPSAFLTYKLTQTKQFKASYSKRVNRPRTRLLNPFTSYDDPLNLRRGNPELDPEYIHAVEVGYQQFSRRGSLSISPFFRRTVNEIERYKTVDRETGVSTMTFRNFSASNSYGAEVVGSMKFGGALSAFASFNAYRVVTDASNVEAGLGNDALAWTARVNATWQVRDGLDVQAFYFYRAPMDVAQGRISSFSMANLALRQKLFDDKGSLSLRVSDPFNTMGFSFETGDEVFYQTSSRKWESRVVYLTFTYSFGQQPRQRNRRGRGDEGESMGGEVGIE